MPFRISERCNNFLALCFQNRFTATISTFVAGTAIAATADKIYHSPAVNSLYAQFCSHKDTTAVPFFKREVLPIFYKQGQLTRVGAAISAVVTFKALSVLLNKIFPSLDAKKALKERIAALTAQLRAAPAQSANNQPQPTAAEMQQQIEAAEQARKHLTDLNGQIATLTIQLSAAQAKLSEVPTNANATVLPGGALQGNDQEAERAKEQLAEVQDQLTKARQDLVAKDTNLTDARLINAKARLDLKQATDARDILAQELEKLKTQIQEPSAQPQENANAATAQLAEQLKTAQEQLVESERNLQTKTDAYEAAQTEHQGVAARLAALTTEHAGCAEDLRLMTECRDELVKNSQVSIANLEKQIASLKDERKLLEQQVEAQQTSLGEMQTKLAAATQQVSAQERAEINRLRTLEGTLNRRVNELNEEVTRQTAAAQTAQIMLQKHTASTDKASLERRQSLSGAGSPRNEPPVAATPSPKVSTTATTTTTSTTPLTAPSTPTTPLTAPSTPTIPMASGIPPHVPKQDRTTSNAKKLLPDKVQEGLDESYQARPKGKGTVTNMKGLFENKNPSATTGVATTTTTTTTSALTASQKTGLTASQKMGSPPKKRKGQGQGKTSPQKTNQANTDTTTTDTASDNPATT